MRLFIALEIPDDWREAAARAVAALVAASPHVLRPVDPALMHLTLRFLGEVDPAAEPELQAALDHEVPPVDVALRLGAPGTFGPPARTAVAWLGIGGDLDALAALVARAERAVVAAGLPTETRPFRAHLTLARVSRRASAADRRAVAAAVEGLTMPDPEAFRARAIALIESHLGGPQPRYEVRSHHG